MLADLIHMASACFLPLAILAGLWLYASMRELTARAARDAAQTECIRVETAHTRALTIVLAGEMGARAALEFVRADVIPADDDAAILAEGHRAAALLASTASAAQLDAAVRAGLTRHRSGYLHRPLRLADRGLS